jgi:hypothetical protein
VTVKMNPRRGVKKGRNNGFCVLSTGCILLSTALFHSQEHWFSAIISVTGSRSKRKSTAARESVGNAVNRIFQKQIAVRCSGKFTYDIDEETEKV